MPGKAGDPREQPRQNMPTPVTYNPTTCTDETPTAFADLKPPG